MTRSQNEGSRQHSGSSSQHTGSGAAHPKAAGRQAARRPQRALQAGACVGVAASPLLPQPVVDTSFAVLLDKGRGMGGHPLM